MRKQLIQIIKDQFPGGIDTASDDWQSVLDRCDHVPSIYHLFSTTQYYVAYFSENYSINLSIVLYSNKQSVAVFPLMVHQHKKNHWLLSSNGVEIVEPIFDKKLARKVKKRLESQLAEAIIALSKTLNITQCQFANMEYHQLTSWYLMWANKAQEAFSTQHLLVDLTAPLNEIRLQFRKSFKPLINKGLREWHVEVHENVSKELFEQFRLLHKEVAGRSTRPIESWQEQQKRIDLKEAFLVTVSKERKELVGSGFFTYSNYQGLYSVGAYKRELFNKPIGHAVQIKSIEFLKEKGCKWYEIGQKHLEIDKVKPTDKELSISHFKEGFATHVIARQHLIVHMLE